MGRPDMMYVGDIGLTASELEEMMKKEKHLLIYDLRPKSEYCKGHIHGSILVGKSIETDDQKIPIVPENTLVVLVGKNEDNERKLAELMRSSGDDVYYLKGGINSWTKRLYFINPAYAEKGYSNK